MKQFVLTLFGIASLYFAAMGQHHPQEDQLIEAAHSAHFPHWRAAVVLGHTYIPAIASEKHFFIPSWGLDVEFWFNESFAIGIHNDIELQTFLIEHQNEMDLEREYPLVITLDAIFKAWKGLVLQVGPGYEFEKTENFFLIRAGIEYEIEFGKHWDVSPMVFYDTRFEANDTWTIGLGLGKRF